MSHILAGQMFQSQNNVIGFTSGKLSLQTDVEATINIGSGLLIVHSYGAAVCEVYGIDYWSSDIQEIYKTKNPVGVSITKAENTGQIVLQPSKTRTIAYIFIGEMII